MAATSHVRFAHPGKQSHRVLVIDDHLDTAEVICTILELHGHTTRAAHTGSSAIAQAYAFDPSVVICGTLSAVETTPGPMEYPHAVREHLVRSDRQR